LQTDQVKEFLILRNGESVYNPNFFSLGIWKESFAKTRAQRIDTQPSRYTSVRILLAPILNFVLFCIQYVETVKFCKIKNLIWSLSRKTQSFRAYLVYAELYMYRGTGAFSPAYDLIWLLPPSFSLVSSTVEKQEDWETETTCWSGDGGSNSYDGEKAWSSVIQFSPRSTAIEDQQFHSKGKYDQWCRIPVEGKDKKWQDTGKWKPMNLQRHNRADM
jgi:hypothetical protein